MIVSKLKKKKKKGQGCRTTGPVSSKNLCHENRDRLKEAYGTWQADANTVLDEIQIWINSNKAHFGDDWVMSIWFIIRWDEMCWNGKMDIIDQKKKKKSR